MFWIRSYYTNVSNISGGRGFTTFLINRYSIHSHNHVIKNEEQQFLVFESLKYFSFSLKLYYVKRPATIINWEMMLIEPTFLLSASIITAGTDDERENKYATMHQRNVSSAFCYHFSRVRNALYGITPKLPRLSSGWCFYRPLAIYDVSEGLL